MPEKVTLPVFHLANTVIRLINPGWIDKTYNFTDNLLLISFKVLSIFLSSSYNEINQSYDQPYYRDPTCTGTTGNETTCNRKQKEKKDRSEERRVGRE